MQYLSAKEITEKWGVSPILVRRLCRHDRILGAVYKDGIWRIPEDAIRVLRTDLEYTSEQELPELAKKLQNQKKKRNFYGLYDFAVIDLTYAPSRMASCRLIRLQLETIFKKGKVRESFEPMKVISLFDVFSLIEQDVAKVTQIKDLCDIWIKGDEANYVELIDRLNAEAEKRVESNRRSKKYMRAKKINNERLNRWNLQ